MEHSEGAPAKYVLAIGESETGKPLIAFINAEQHLIEIAETHGLILDTTRPIETVPDITDTDMAKIHMKVREGRVFTKEEMLEILRGPNVA